MRFAPAPLDADTTAWRPRVSWVVAFAASVALPLTATGCKRRSTAATAPAAAPATTDAKGQLASGASSAGQLDRCKDALANLEKGKMPDVGLLARMGFATPEAFQKKLIDGNPLFVCQAIMSNSTDGCGAYRDATDQDACIHGVQTYGSSTDIRSADQVLVPAEFPERCLADNSPVVCDQVAHAIRTRQPSQCPHTEASFHALCEAWASGNPAACPTNKLGAPCRHDLQRISLLKQGEVVIRAHEKDGCRTFETKWLAGCAPTAASADGGR